MLKQGKCRLASEEGRDILSIYHDRINIERMQRILRVEKNSELPQVFQLGSSIHRRDIRAFQAIGFHTLEIAESLSRDCLSEVDESGSIRDALVSIRSQRINTCAEFQLIYS